MRKFVLGIVFLLFTALQLMAQTATLRGNVADEKTGETIIGASVIIEGTTIGDMTDFDGNFVINNVPVGTHNLKCSFISYETEIQEITLSANQELTINFILGEAVVQVDEVRVVAKVNRETEALLLMDQKEAEGIKESIGARRMSSLGISDAAAATTKIAGVTKNEGSGDVYIRGLGDRYLTTTMNGLPIPSDDVDKKNINLNLFSTDVIKNININKTFDVATYGDQSSGSVNINSKSFSDQIEIGLKAGSSTNILSNGVFGNCKATQNINDLSFGFYNSKRTLEESLYKQSWNTVDYGPAIDRSFSFAGGTRTKLFYRDFTVFGTVSHDNNYDYRIGEYRKYRTYVKDKEYTDWEQFTSTINTTALLNLGYELSKNININYYALFVNKVKDELAEGGRNGEGFYYDQIPQETETFVRDQNIKQTQLFINQLLGDIKFSDNNKLSWALGYNMVNADEPNRIRNRVVVLEEDEVFFVSDTYYEESKSAQLISDKEFNGFIKEELKFADTEKQKLKATIGANARYKTRDFYSEKLALKADKKVRGTSIDNLDEVLANPEDFDLDFIDQKPDLYDGSLLAYAGFLNVSFQQNALSGNVGLRFERDELNVSWDVANYFNLTTGRSRKSSLEEEPYNIQPYNEFLPSLSLKYSLNDKNSVRLAGSKTMTLPEFKELAPFEYVNAIGDVFVGNPELIKSSNYNFDLKYEFFPSAKELVSITGFYKMINDPINLGMTTGSSGNFKYYNTGDQANVYGLEFETKWEIIKMTGTGHPDLNLSVNATKMWFNQDLNEQFQYNGKSEIDLQGAAGFIANGSLIYSTNTENELAATISGNYSSDKIYALGAAESQAYRDTYFNNEIIEKGFATIDMVISKKISKRVALKITGKNLLNPEIKQTQEVMRPKETPQTIIRRSYKKGIGFSLGLKINLN